MAVTSGTNLLTERATPSSTRFLDRWIWVLLAAFFVALTLAGFIPSSLRKLHAIQAGERPALPWFLHFHAVAMGLWMLLLLTQTALMGYGRRLLHMWLGAASLVIAPLLVGMMTVMAGSIWAQIKAAPVEVPLADIGEAFGFVLFVQGRSILLFAICFAWAYRTRLTDSGTHKRMMMLATWALIDPAIARIPGSNELGVALGLESIGLTSNDDIPHFWMLITLLPVVLYETVRDRRIHRAWLAGLAMFAVFAVVAHITEAAPPWWQDISARLIGRHAG
jgi:hypothetical protein